MKQIANFDNWNEVTRGVYKILDYEIILIHFPHNSNILDADAELYMTGDWYVHETGEEYFGRNLLKCGTVQECIEAAYKNDNT